MKFSCGPTEQEKGRHVQWLAKELGEWHRAFLWLPTTVGEKNGKKVCAWLQHAWRRTERPFNYDHFYSAYDNLRRLSYIRYEYSIEKDKPNE